jgi:methionyl-tRNA synthetase
MTYRLYRRRINTYTWHFCENCPAWLGDEYQETTRPSQWGELCSECQALLLRQDCTTLNCWDVADQASQIKRLR